MWGDKQRRIDHLQACCDRLAEEKADKARDNISLAGRLADAEELLAEAHNLIDAMAGEWEENLSRCRELRSKMTERRRVPGQEDVVRGLATWEQGIEPELVERG